MEWISEITVMATCTFDNGKKLTADQIAEVVDCVKVSRSTNVVISKEDLALLGDKYIVK